MTVETLVRKDIVNKGVPGVDCLFSESSRHGHSFSSSPPNSTCFQPEEVGALDDIGSAENKESPGNQATMTEVEETGVENGCFEPSGSSVTERKNENGHMMPTEEENDTDNNRNHVLAEVEKIERKQDDGQMETSED